MTPQPNRAPMRLVRRDDDTICYVEPDPPRFALDVPRLPPSWWPLALYVLVSLLIITYWSGAWGAECAEGTVYDSIVNYSMKHNPDYGRLQNPATSPYGLTRRADPENPLALQNQAAPWSYNNPANRVAPWNPLAPQNESNRDVPWRGRKAWDWDDASR